MKNFKDLSFEFKKSWYNKSKVQTDGITHIIDTDTQYPLYQFGLAKNYFDVDSKEEVLDLIISDLTEFTNYLKQVRQQEQQRQGEEK